MLNETSKNDLIRRVGAGPGDSSKAIPQLFVPTRLDAGARRLVDTFHTSPERISRDLLAYGAILFRGFQPAAIEDVLLVAREFSERGLFSYAGGASPRTSLRAGVYTSTEYPPEMAANFA